MTSPRLCLVTLCLALASCATADAPPEEGGAGVDAASSTIPRDLAGTFDVTTVLDLPVSDAARPLLELVQRATDGVDDPMRYVLDRMIAQLPDGTARTFAEVSAPFIAAYLDERLAEVAPRFAPGLRAIALGLARVATHVELAETLTVDTSGAAVRTIHGARFDVRPDAPMLAFATHGLGNPAVATRLTLDRRGAVSVARHVIALRHGALVRLGLDRAVIPAVEPRSRELASALALLVDCERLGELVAEKLGLGSPVLYGSACSAGMTALASELYARIAAIDDAPLALELAGTADGFDVDGNGTLDELRSGQWTGTVAASFTGARSR